MSHVFSHDVQVSFDSLDVCSNSFRKQETSKRPGSGSREEEQNTSGMKGERGIMEQEELSWVGKRRQGRGCIWRGIAYTKCL